MSGLSRGRAVDPKLTPAQRRVEILGWLNNGNTEHTAALADLTGIPLSTLRRDLLALEAEGVVRGIKHDERRIVHGGRVRIYWRVVPQPPGPESGADYSPHPSVGRLS